MQYPDKEKPLDQQTTITMPVVTIAPSWPPPPRPRPPQGPALWLKILIASLAALMVLGALGLLIYTTTDQFNKTLGAPAFNATATVRGALNYQATRASQQRATAVPVETANAPIYATATAQAGASATVSAATAQGTVAVQSMAALLGRATGGTPALNDPLSSNSQGNIWDVGYTDNNNSGCNFVNSSYQVLEALPGILRPCFADKTTFSNFAYQVALTMNSNCAGGVILRGNKNANNYYLFTIDADGSYQFEVYNGSHYYTLVSGNSAAILPVGQANTLAVIADQGVFDLFINQTFVAESIDGQLSSGQVGVIVDNTGVPASASFSNAEVWKL
jgi:hypothetical protein